MNRDSETQNDVILEKIKQKFIQDLEKRLVDPLIVLSEYLKVLISFQQSSNSISNEIIEKAFKDAEITINNYLIQMPVDNTSSLVFENHALLLQYLQVLALEDYFENELKKNKEDQLMSDEEIIEKIINNTPEHLKIFIPKEKRDVIRNYVEGLGYNFFLEFPLKYRDRIMEIYTRVINQSYPIRETNLKTWFSAQLNKVEHDLSKKKISELESLQKNFKKILENLTLNADEITREEESVEKFQLQAKQNIYGTYKNDIQKLLNKINQEILKKQELQKKFKRAVKKAYITRVNQKLLLTPKIEGERGLNKMAAQPNANVIQNQSLKLSDKQNKLIKPKKNEAEQQKPYEVTLKIMEKYYFLFLKNASINDPMYSYLKVNLEQNAKTFNSAQKYLFDKMDHYLLNNNSDEIKKFVDNVLKKEAIQFILNRNFFGKDPLIRIEEKDLMEQDIIIKNALENFKKFLNNLNVKTPKNEIEKKFKEFLFKQIYRGNEGEGMSISQVQNMIQLLNNKGAMDFFLSLFKHTLEYSESSWHQKFSKESIDCAPLIISELLQSKNIEELIKKAEDFSSFHQEHPATHLESLKNKAANFKKYVSKKLKHLKADYNLVIKHNPKI